MVKLKMQKKDLVLQVGGLDSRLATLLCLFFKSKQVKTRHNLAEYSMEGYQPTKGCFAVADDDVALIWTVKENLSKHFVMVELSAK
jgi:hypothetical protein